MSPKYLLPQELAKPPIESALFELRFTPASNDVLDRLPGLLRTALGYDYLQSAELPIERRATGYGSAPSEARYQPRISFAGRGAAILIGECVAAVQVEAPYPGWSPFRTRIDSLLEVLQLGGLVSNMERISLKFVNFLRGLPERQLDELTVGVTVAGEPIPENGLRLRMELNDDIFSRVVELETGAIGAHPDGTREERGLRLSIDCIRPLAHEEFWPRKSDLIEDLQFESRAMFFRLLSPGFIERLGPIYRSEPKHD